MKAHGHVAKLADALALGASGEIHVGSTPAVPTKSVGWNSSSVSESLSAYPQHVAWREPFRFSATLDSFIKGGSLMSEFDIY